MLLPRHCGGSSPVCARFDAPCLCHDALAHALMLPREHCVPMMPCRFSCACCARARRGKIRQSAPARGRQPQRCYIWRQGKSAGRCAPLFCCQRYAACTRYACYERTAKVLMREHAAMPDAAAANAFCFSRRLLLCYARDVVGGVACAVFLSSGLLAAAYAVKSAYAQLAHMLAAYAAAAFAAAVRVASAIERERQLAMFARRRYSATQRPRALRASLLPLRWRVSACQRTVSLQPDNRHIQRQDERRVPPVRVCVLADSHSRRGQE